MSGRGTIAAMALAVAVPAQEPPERGPVFPAAVERVTVDVVVSDRHGAPVLDLGAGDFTIEEDGVRQAILAFEAIDARPPSGRPLAAEPVPAPDDVAAAGPQPERIFVLVFDDLHIDAADAPRARQALLGFLDGAADGDRVTLVATARGTPWHARMPEGRATLREAVRELAPRARTGERANEWMSDDEAVRIRDGDPLVEGHVARRWRAAATDVLTARDPTLVDTRVRDAAMRIAFDAQRRTRATLDAIVRAADSVSGARGRKAVVLVSGGFVRDSSIPEFSSAVRAAQRANVAIYFLDARGLVALAQDLTAEAAAPTDLQDQGRALGAVDGASGGGESLAADTGGFSIQRRNDLGPGLAAIARESSRYYLLGYAPPTGRPDQGFRRIRVRVAREDVRVRARRGYYPTRPGEPSTAGRAAELQRAVDSPLDARGIPLRAAVHVLGDRPGGRLQVLVTAELDVTTLALREEGGVAVDTLDYVVAIAGGHDGAQRRSDERLALRLGPGEKERLSRTWLALTREAVLAPGPYQVRCVARDANSGRVGSVLLDVEVPPVGGLRVSTPVLSDRLLEGGRGPVVIARNAFAPRGVLHVRFEVHGAAKGAGGRPFVTAGFAVHRTDGRLLAAAPASAIEPTPDGGLSRAFGLPLDGVAEGPYELLVVVEDGTSGQRAEARVTFFVEGA